MTNKIEWVCTKCMWEGVSPVTTVPESAGITRIILVINPEDTNRRYHCPECGAEVERPTDAPIWEHFHDYNRNKK